jgi:hypothetical protein
MAIDPSGQAGNDNPVVLGGIEQTGSMNQGLHEPGFERTGPILTVERFKQEYLFGIPLVASLTQEKISDETLKQFIKKGIGEFETSVRVPVHSVKIVDRFDFERADDLRFGTRRFTRWPVQKVERLNALWPGRNESLGSVDPTLTQEISYPTSWVTLQGDTGLFRIIPNSGTLVNADVNFLASSAYRTVVLGGLKAWPNLWRVTYIAGFQKDCVPDIVNDLIGILAAIKLLSQLGPAIFPVASQSVSIDGMSQGTGTGGPQWLAQRITELSLERDRLVQQLKQHYATDIQMWAF